MLGHRAAAVADEPGHSRICTTALVADALCFPLDAHLEPARQGREQCGGSFEPGFAPFERPVGGVAAAADAVAKRQPLLPDRGHQCQRRDAGGRTFVAAAAVGGVVGERLAEEIAGAIEALTRHGEQAVQCRQRARQGTQPVALAGEDTGLCPLKPGGERSERRLEFGLHRDRHLGRPGGRRRPTVGGMVDQRPVGLVADGRDQRNVGGGRGAHHCLVVEAPEILETAAATGDDDQVRPCNRPVRGKRIETVDGIGDLRAAAFALHPHRPDHDMEREAVGDPVQDVTDDGSGGRGDDTNHARHVGQKLLARLVEQALSGKLFAARLQKRHQRAGAGGLHLLDDDLVARLAGEGGQPSGGDDLEPLFGKELPVRHDTLPGDGGQDGVLVLEIEIDVAGPGAAQPSHLAAHANMAEGILHRPADGTGKLADREFGRVGRRFVEHRHGGDFRTPGPVASSRNRRFAPSQGTGEQSQRR